MSKRAATFLTSIIVLQGCVMLNERHVQDIPQRPIVEEQDTPFVFKEAYQKEGLYSTQTHVETPNDFVDIAASTEYVWWFPTASTDVYSASIDMQEPPLESDSQDAQPTQPAAAKNTLPAHTTSLVKALDVTCADIFCLDSNTRCGTIEVCSGALCDEAKQAEYQCQDEHCSQVTASMSINVAKGESLCDKYPERDVCPQSTVCKQMDLDKSGVTLNQAKRLAFKELDSE